MKKREFILKLTLSLPLPSLMLKLPSGSGSSSSSSSNGSSSSSSNGSNGNRTEWSPIWSVIIRVINSDLFNLEYDYRLNWTIRSSVTN